MAGASEVRWMERDDGGWRCLLCPRGCVMSDGAPLGACRVRGVREGAPFLPGWGGCVSLAVDPVEKKPLHHFLPGSSILSTGPAGCNLTCCFCQNWEISQGNPPTRLLQPRELAGLALSRGSSGIAFTYTEPVVWFEYIEATAPLVRSAGGAVAMVSNGWVRPEPLAEYLTFTDAWNVDLKGWGDGFYARWCGGSAGPVRRTIETIAASGVHLEVTFLVIPGLNDSREEWREMARWLSGSAGRGVPLHVSRYFPRYRLEAPPTPAGTIEEAVQVFSEHLDFVYPGNVGAGADTRCPGCGALLVRRRGWDVALGELDPSGACRSCGRMSGIVTRLPSR